MSNYIPHNRKKMQILRKREQKLRRLIASGASNDKLLSAALEVRDGRIRVVRAQVGYGAKDSISIKALKALSAGAVLAEYLAGR